MDIFASSFGVNEQGCFLGNPCNFTNVLDLIHENDILHITDSKLIDGIIIDEFREVVNTCFQKNVTIMGNNTILEGKKSKHYYPALLYGDGIEMISLSKFSFIQFSTTLFSFRNISSLLLSEIDVNSTNLNQQLSLIIITGCSFRFSDINIVKCSVHDSSFFNIGKSNGMIINSSLRNNMAFHMSDSPFFHVSSSVLECNNLNIVNSHFPYSPFFILTGSSSELTVKNSAINNNFAAEFIFSESNSKAHFYNSTYDSNFGMFINTIFPMEIIIDQTNFSLNNSPEYFCIIGKSVISLLNSKFEENAIEMFFESGNITMTNNAFLSNTPRDHLITINCSVFQFLSNAFNDTSPIISDIVFINSKGNINGCSFLQSTESSLWLEQISYVTIDSSLFGQSRSFRKTSITVEPDSFLYLKNSEFLDKSPSSLINSSHLSKVNLKNLTFHSSQEMTIPGLSCSECHFVASNSIVVNDFHRPEAQPKGILILGFTVLLIVILLMFYRRRVIRFLKRRIPKNSLE